MSSEPDCTASSGSGFILESSLSNIINHRKSKLNNNNNEDTDCDLEKAVCASSNNNNCNVNNLNTNNGNVNSSAHSNNNESKSNLATTPTTTSTNFLNDAASPLVGKFCKLSISPKYWVNLSSFSDFFCPVATLKCERCDSFETISHALLLVHVAQCRGDVNSVNTGSSRQFGIDSESGNENDSSHSTMDTATVATSSSTLHLNNDGNG